MAVDYPDSAEALFETVLDTESPIYLTITDSRILSSFVLTVSSEELPDAVYLLTRDSLFDSVGSKFIIASHLAELTEEDQVKIATVSGLSNNYCTSQESTAVFVKGSSAIGLFSSSDTTFTDDLYERSVSHWQRATRKPLSIPSLSTQINTLTRVSEAVASDYETAFTNLVAHSPPKTNSIPQVDPVELSLLLTAKNEKLYYHVSRWGENQGIGSLATFSRIKSQLEDANIIDTTKVPVEIGRPRQRLVLTADSLSDHTDLLDTDMAAFEPFTNS